jgi:hypothetical protein
LKQLAEIRIGDPTGAQINPGNTAGGIPDDGAAGIRDPLCIAAGPYIRGRRRGDRQPTEKQSRQSRVPIL